MQLNATKPIFLDHAPIDETQLRRTLGNFATGITVATTLHDGIPIGFTANSFTSVSLRPPLILICIANHAAGCAAFRQAAAFCVNILSATQQSVSDTFAKQGANKFADVTWTRCSAGAPLLSGIAAHLSCEAYDWIEAGDHSLMIGRVVDLCAHERAPLCYHRGQYAALSPLSSVGGG